MASSFERELSIWSDFNSIDPHRSITASLRFAATAERPLPGERVRLYDDEGNSVMGIVERVEDLVVHVRPDIDTWVTADISLTPFARSSPFSAEPQ